MITSEQEKEAWSIIKQADNERSSGIKASSIPSFQHTPPPPACPIPQFANDFLDKLCDSPPDIVIAISGYVNQEIHSRLRGHLKNYEDHYMDLKDKVAFIDEFLKRDAR